MRTPGRIAALAIVAALTGTACVGAAQPGPSLEGRTFLSVKVSTADVDRPLVPGTRVRLSFENGNLAASAGCNTMSGTYTLDGDVLRVAGVATTEMGCDPDRHAQDDWLFGFLSSGPTLQLTGNDLLLTGGDTILQLIDRTIAEPDRPLEGTLWVVDSVIQGSGVSSVPPGVVATFRFTAGGQLELDTSCNAGGGVVRVEGSSLQFEPIVLTKRGCEGDRAGMERAVVAVLASGRVDFSIQADRLTLHGDEVGLGLRAAAGS